MKNEELHIGKQIEQKMSESGTKVSWLAKQVSCNRSHIYRIYQQKYIDIELLIKICIKLKVNLFTLYAEYIDGKIHKHHDKK